MSFVIFLHIGFCAIYNTEEMKVIDDFNIDCTNFTEGPCPTRYISTDAYMCRFSIIIIIKKKITTYSMNHYLVS